MMKSKRLIRLKVWMKVYTMMLLCFSFTLVHAQEASVASGGDASSNDGTVSYSIGQVVYTTHDGVNGTISQGVQQAYEIYSVGINAMPENMAMSVFPNPTTDNLTLQVDRPDDQEMYYQLIDMQGPATGRKYSPKSDAG